MTPINLHFQTYKTMKEITTQTGSLKAIISSDKMQAQFAASLPSHLSPERFARVAITALTRSPKLAECTQESFFKCLLDLSAMGLEPDGRRAHLIPYGKTCTLILDYKGLVELMRRSGDVATIHADVVCANDTFAHNLGEITEHTFSLAEDRGEMIAAYSQITFKDGSKQSAIMTKTEIDAIKNRSRSGSSGPWKTDYNEMAKKTVVRRVSKMITLSPEIMDAVERSDRHEFGEMRTVSDFKPDINSTVESLKALAQPNMEETAE
jgi:recombination protein RecT